jgi:hypothetical protein
MSSASNADIAAGCSAGIFASLMGLNPRNIASAGGCHLITRSLHRPIRSGVRQWQSRSVLVANRRKPSCRLPKWSQRAHSGVAANCDRQPRSSSHAAARRSRESASGSGLYAIALADPGLMALAGLWETWRSPAAERVRSFAIVTTTPNALCAELHDRMPVVLRPDVWPEWLGEEPVAPARLKILLVP